MHRLRELSGWIIAGLLVVALGLFRYSLPTPSGFPIIPSPVVRDPTNPLLGAWRLTQQCGSLRLPSSVIFLQGGRFESNLRDIEPKTEGTYEYLSGDQVRLRYGNQSMDFTLTGGPDHMGLIHKLIHEEPYPSYETEIYTLCRGEWCIQGDCSA